MSRLSSFAFSAGRDVSPQTITTPPVSRTHTSDAVGASTARTRWAIAGGSSRSTMAAAWTAGLPRKAVPAASPPTVGELAGLGSGVLAGVLAVLGFPVWPGFLVFPDLAPDLRAWLGALALPELPAAAPGQGSPAALPTRSKGNPDGRWAKVCRSTPKASTSA